MNRVLRLGENKLYEKLGVPRDADEAALKKAYKKLSLKLHPDRNPHPKAEAAFQAVNKAHEVLPTPDGVSSQTAAATNLCYCARC